MQRGYNNYSFVVDNTFRPFSMQEMLQPLVAYKEEYDKREEDYLNLVDKSDKFKYLSETLPEGSKSRQIYEGYANELNKQAEDLAKHGLSMGNRRSLMNLKRRYQGEIGRLVSADAAMEEERKLRRTMNAKDSSMLYANDNLNIDDFLDGSTPNLYNISGTELYTRGAAAGKAASSRVYSSGDEGSTLGGYYRKWVEKNGYNADSINKFRANAAAIPELQQAADNILAERGVLENLTGANLERARQSVLNGIIDGAVYSEKVNPVRDPGVMSASERDSSARGWASHNESVRMHNLQLKMSGYDENGVYHPENDQAVQKAKAIAEAKGQGKSGSTGVAYDARNKAMTMVGAKSGSVYKHQDSNGKGTSLEDTPMRALTEQEYSRLVDAHGNITNQYLRSAVGNGQLSDYEIYVIPSGSTKIDGSGWLWDDKLGEDVYVAIPRDSKKAATDFTGNISTSGYGGDYNDVPE